MNDKETMLAERPDWRWWAKSIAVAIVAGATVLRQAEVPPAMKIACDVAVGIGAAFGIISAGLSRSR